MEGVLILSVLGAGLVAVLLKRSSSATRGSRGERVVHGILAQSLPSSEYTVLRAVTLGTEYGAAQIDHIVVSRFGIFVIGTEDLSGQIFGAENAAYWIQSLADSRFEFQNPLARNREHIQALRKLLGLHVSRFHSLVVFTGRAEFKSPMPPNVMHPTRLVPYIEVRSTPCLDKEAVAQAVRLIESSRLEPGTITDASQIDSPRTDHGAVPGPDSGARVPLWKPFGAPLALRALAGVVSIALLLVAGNVLFQGLTGLSPAGNGRPPAFPALQPSPNPRCEYSIEAEDCSCQDLDGVEVPMDPEKCREMADADEDGKPDQ